MPPEYDVHAHKRALRITHTVETLPMLEEVLDGATATRIGPDQLLVVGGLPNVSLVRRLTVGSGLLEEHATDPLVVPARGSPIIADPVRGFAYVFPGDGGQVSSIQYEPDRVGDYWLEPAGPAPQGGGTGLPPFVIDSTTELRDDGSVTYRARTEAIVRCDDDERGCYVDSLDVGIGRGHTAVPADIEVTVDLYRLRASGRYGDDPDDTYVLSSLQWLPSNADERTDRWTTLIPPTLDAWPSGTKVGIEVRYSKSAAQLHQRPPSQVSDFASPLEVGAGLRSIATAPNSACNPSTLDDCLWYLRAAPLFLRAEGPDDTPLEEHPVEVQGEVLVPPGWGYAAPGGVRAADRAPVTATVGGVDFDHYSYALPRRWAQLTDHHGLAAPHLQLWDEPVSIPCIAGCGGSPNTPLHLYFAGDIPIDIADDLFGGHFATDAAQVATALGGAYNAQPRAVFVPDVQEQGQQRGGVTYHNQLEVFTAPRTFAHEITHVLLASQAETDGLLLPRWLNEGLAVTMEGTARSAFLRERTGATDLAEQTVWYNGALELNALDLEGCHPGNLDGEDLSDELMLYQASPYLLHTHHAFRRAADPSADFWAYWRALLQPTLASGQPLDTPTLLAQMDADAGADFQQYHQPGGAGPRCPGVPILAFDPVVVHKHDVDPNAPKATRAMQWADADLTVRIRQVQHHRVPNGGGNGGATAHDGNWRVFSRVPYALACAPQKVHDTPGKYDPLRTHSLFGCEASWFDIHSATDVPPTVTTPAYRLDRVAMLHGADVERPLTIEPNAIFDGQDFVDPFPATIRLYSPAGLGHASLALPAVASEIVSCGPDTSTDCVTDGDADGVPRASDCNDGLPNVFPGALENLFHDNDPDCNCVVQDGGGVPSVGLEIYNTDGHTNVLRSNCKLGL